MEEHKSLHQLNLWTLPGKSFNGDYVTMQFFNYRWNLMKNYSIYRVWERKPTKMETSHEEENNFIQKRQWSKLQIIHLYLVSTRGFKWISLTRIEILGLRFTESTCLKLNEVTYFFNLNQILHASSEFLQDVILWCTLL